MTSKGRSALVLSLLALSLATSLSVQRLKAQVLYGSITGTVTDQTGAVVPTAHVTVTNPLTGLKRETDANAAGQYLIANLPEGAYNLAVSAKGFKESNQTGLVVKVGSVVRADLSLEVGAMTQEVTVQASAAQLQTEKSEVSTALGTVPVENLPTGFYRNYQYLMLLVPGAADNLGTTGALADTPERAIAIPMNGLGPASNSTRIDGAQSIFLWKPGGAALYVPPVESIQEVKITTNSYDPEKGMAGSAAIDVITKAGTNDLHGTAFWYHHNQHLTSCDPFDQNCKWKVFDATHPRSKPKEILNDIGGNLGGPIKRDKLFFFANWDGVFQRDTPDARYAVPPSDMRNGDFSKYLGARVSKCLQRDSNDQCTQSSPMMVPTSNGHGVLGPAVQLQQGMVFDPKTGNPDGTGRAVYAAGTTATSVGQRNVMPADLFDPTARTILGFWPEPNVAQGLWTFDTQGVPGKDFFLNAPQRFNRNNIDLKFDWNRTDKHMVWAKYSRMMTLTAVTCGYNRTIGGPCPAGSDGNTNVLVQTATVGQTWSLSPTFVADGSLGFSRMGQKGTPSDFGKNIGLDVLKIPGTNDPSDVRYSGAPVIGVAGFDDLGSPYTWMPFYRNDWTVTFAQNASWTRSNHTLRFGVDIIHNHLNHWQPEDGFGPRGGVRFNSGDYTFLRLLDATGKPISTDTDFFGERVNQFATFLLGVYDEAGRAIQFQKANGKDTWYGFHFLDRWKVTPRLTANLGVRYEYYPLMSRDSLGKGLEQYDPTTNTVLLGGLGSNPRNLGIKTQKGLIGPRLGLAYELNPNTVLRAGFGSTFDTYPILRETRGAYPAVISTDFVYDSSSVDFNKPSACQNGPSNLCSFQGLGTFADGIPPDPVPDVSQGKIPAPPSVGLRFIGPGLLKRGRVETWNATMERRLPGDFVLGVAYVGNHMTHGWGQINLNASRIDEQAPLSEKWGRTADTFQLQGYLDSHYNALQVSIDRHYSHGLWIKGAYTYSKAIDLYSDEAWGGGLWQAPTFAGPGYRDRNRGMSDNDRRHIFRLGYVWDLPLGAGRRFASSNRIGRAVLGGWQLNGVWSTTSGPPTTLYADPGNLRQAGNHQTVDQIAPIKKLGCLGPDPGCYWYDPSSFAIVPLVTDPDGVQRQHRFGNTGRNIALYGPKQSNLDASLFRHFKLSERFDLQFRAEGLNVLNHPAWYWTTDEWGASNYCWGGGPTNNPCGGTFMQATDARTLANSGYDHAHRIIRFGLRLAF